MSRVFLLWVLFSEIIGAATPALIEVEDLSITRRIQLLFQSADIAKTYKNPKKPVIEYYYEILNLVQFNWETRMSSISNEYALRALIEMSRIQKTPLQERMDAIGHAHAIALRLGQLFHLPTIMGIQATLFQQFHEQAISNLQRDVNNSQLDIVSRIRAASRLLFLYHQSSVIPLVMDQGKASFEALLETFSIEQQKEIIVQLGSESWDSYCQCSDASMLWHSLRLHYYVCHRFANDEQLVEYVTSLWKNTNLQLIGQASGDDDIISWYRAIKDGEFSTEIALKQL